MKKSTAKGRVSKPAPPYPSFPLYAHTSGRWAKRIRGKLHYFGRWGTKKRGRIVPVDDVSASAAAAIDRFHREWPFLSQGRTPPAAGSGQGCDVKALCNVFLTAQQRKCNSNEITARTFEEYRATTDRIVAQFGKDRLIDDLRTEDFESLRAELAKKWGPVSLGNAVQRVRTVFKYGFESGLLPVPIRFGPHFKRPSKSVLRRHRAKSGKRTFEAAEIRDMLEAATIPMRAMIYLGINCGFGNGDCGGLTKSALNLAAGWVDFPRPKTGIERRCPLWPETKAALHEALAARPRPKNPEHAELAFITKYGGPWVNATQSNAVALETGKLLRGLGIHRPRLGFYNLRHTFRTIGDGAKDRTAVRAIMGHVDDSIDAEYTHGIEDERLQSVVDHVRRWLFPPAASEHPPETEEDTSDGGIVDVSDATNVGRAVGMQAGDGHRHD